MTVEEKAYNYASKVVKNRLTASEIAAHYGRGYIDGQEDMKQLGWHPASELPPEEGEYIVISLPDMYGDTDVFYTEYRQPYGWCYEIEGHYAKINIQKWCYPPKED